MYRYTYVHGQNIIETYYFVRTQSSADAAKLMGLSAAIGNSMCYPNCLLFWFHYYLMISQWLRMFLTDSEVFALAC